MQMSLHQASETLIRFALILKNLEADNKHSMNGVLHFLLSTADSSAHVLDDSPR